jgi:nickel-type superoxide dismutase maturation protease
MTALALGSAAAAVTSAAWRSARPRRVRVEGSSMTPTLQPGDRLLVTRALRLRVGALVAVPDPRDRDRLLVKRITSIAAGGVRVEGDNQAASTDSRTFGPVPAASVVGKVRYRYAPPERAGRLRDATPRVVAGPL